MSDRAPSRGAPSRGRRFVFLVGPCVAALALSGCVSDARGAGAEGGGDSGEPVVATAPALLDTAALTLPVERYELAPDQVRRLDKARLILIDRCMNRFGYRYVLPEPPAAIGPQNETARRYGITDAALAATAGYGLGAGDPALQVRPEKPILDGEGQAALYGTGRSTVKGLPVPKEGCVGEAVTALETGQGGADVNLGQKLSAQSFEASQKDSRVQAAFSAWSRCMSGKGYDYPDPLAPLGDPQLEGGAGDEGRKVALLDISCKKTANVVGIWFSVESAYQKRSISQHADSLALTRTAITSSLGRADAVLSGAQG